MYCTHQHHNRRPGNELAKVLQAVFEIIREVERVLIVVHERIVSKASTMRGQEGILPIAHDRLDVGLPVLITGQVLPDAVLVNDGGIRLRLCTGYRLLLPLGLITLIQPQSTQTSKSVSVSSKCFWGDLSLTKKGIERSKVLREISHNACLTTQRKKIAMSKGNYESAAQCPIPGLLAVGFPEPFVGKPRPPSTWTSDNHPFSKEGRASLKRRFRGTFSLAAGGKFLKRSFRLQGMLFPEKNVPENILAREGFASLKRRFRGTFSLAAGRKFLKRSFRRRGMRVPEKNVLWNILAREGFSSLERRFRGTFSLAAGCKFLNRPFSPTRDARP